MISVACGRGASPRSSCSNWSYSARQALARDLIGRQVKGHLTIAQADHAREVRQRHVHLVQRGHQGDAALPRAAEQRLDGLARARGVERRERLVDQPEPCRAPAAHAPGPRAGARRPKVGRRARTACRPDRSGPAPQKRPGCRSGRTASAGWLSRPMAGRRAGQHRGDHALARRQRRHLRGQKQLAAQPLKGVTWQSPGRHAIQLEKAAARRQRAGQHLQQRGLARARRADHRDLFAMRDLQVDRAHGGQRTSARRRVPSAQRLEFNLQAVHRSEQAGRTLRAAASMPL